MPVPLPTPPSTRRLGSLNVAAAAKASNNNNNKHQQQPHFEAGFRSVSPRRVHAGRNAVVFPSPLPLPLHNGSSRRYLALAAEKDAFSQNSALASTATVRALQFDYPTVLTAQDADLQQQQQWTGEKSASSMPNIADMPSIPSSFSCTLQQQFQGHRDFMASHSAPTGTCALLAPSSTDLDEAVPSLEDDASLSAGEEDSDSSDGADCFGFEMDETNEEEAEEEEQTENFAAAASVTVPGVSLCTDPTLSHRPHDDPLQRSWAMPELGCSSSPVASILTALVRAESVPLFSSPSPSPSPSELAVTDAGVIGSPGSPSTKRVSFAAMEDWFFHEHSDWLDRLETFRREKATAQLQSSYFASLCPTLPFGDRRDDDELSPVPSPTPPPPSPRVTPSTPLLLASSLQGRRLMSFEDYGRDCSPRAEEASTFVGFWSSLASCLFGDD
ncbi:hypothetical protein DFJ73DRAFT_827480 [Zopfochytrium polystomum]|nr:hypothetical protein DFJ73DRAFT_827480 [Zopfochytrium polystomum]